MAVSLVSTGVQFPDSTIQTTAAAASGSTTGTASGSIAAGAPTIVNSDGTFSAVTGATFSVGSPTQFAATARTFTFSEYEPTSGNFIQTYTTAGGSSAGLVYVASVSGTTVTYGTGVNPNGSGTIDTIRCTAIGSSKILCTYYLNNGYTYAVVGTVSGTSISFGTPVQFPLQNSTNAYPVYNPSTGTVFVAWTSAANGYPYGNVVSISGTTCSVGSTVNIHLNAGYSTCGVYDASIAKVVLFYSGSSSYLSSRVITMSGTSFSVGTESQYTAQAITNGFASAYNASTASVVTAVHLTSNLLYALVSQNTSSTVTFGTPVAVSGFGTNTGLKTYATYVNAAGQVCFVGAQPSPYYLSFAMISNSGLVPTVSTANTQLNTETQFNGNYETFSAAWSTAINKMYTPTYLASMSARGGLVFTPPYTNVTTDNFLGLSTASYTNGQTATVNVVGGVNTSVTSLTAGRKYYVQGSGALSTTAGNPNVYAGLATAATKIVVKG